MADWIFLATVLVVLATAATWLFRLRARRIARSRAGESYEDFAAHFVRQGIEDEVIVAVYRYFQRRMRRNVEHFPVRAGDDVTEVYGIIEDDVDDAVEELLAGRARPTLGLGALLLRGGPGE